jgi:hypothetical protein
LTVQSRDVSFPTSTTFFLCYYIALGTSAYQVPFYDLQTIMSSVQERRKVPKLHKHFFMNSALLALIDPVRGTPTKDSLGACYPQDEFLQSYQVKQRFLDSFAFICSTSSSGKETASAVCMEQNRPSEIILRVARNHGLSLPDLNGLERVLQILIAAARGGM